MLRQQKHRSRGWFKVTFLSPSWKSLLKGSLNNPKKVAKNYQEWFILLMEEILHHLGWLKPYKYHPWSTVLKQHDNLLIFQPHDSWSRQGAMRRNRSFRSRRWSWGSQLVAGQPGRTPPRSYGSSLGQWFLFCFTHNDVTFLNLRNLQGQPAWAVTKR